MAAFTPSSPLTSSFGDFCHIMPGSTSTHAILELNISLIMPATIRFLLLQSTSVAELIELRGFHSCTTSNGDLPMLSCYAELYQNFANGSHLSQLVSALFRYIFRFCLMVLIVHSD